MVEIECVVDCRNVLGEGPIWCPEEKVLWWFDIKGRMISRFTPATDEVRSWPVNEDPGSLALRRDGGLMVAFYGGFRAYDLDSGEAQIIHEIEAETPRSRLNDGRCDRQGRFWAGSMDDLMVEPMGGLYRLDADLSVHKTESDIICSNSIAFSPDGSAIDAEGYLWNAMWDGWCLARWAPDGTLDRTIELPVQRPTCPMFGGEGLDTIYLICASIHLSKSDLAKQPQAGGIFAITGTGANGLPEPRFAG